MSSPLSFFRRNQHVMMVAVVILSMLAFTLDTVFSDRGTHFVLLGLLMGAMIFSFVGINRGRWIQYGVAGGILGAACGFIFPKLVNPNSAFFQESKLGAFDEQRIFDLQLQRNIPNLFMQQAFEKAIAPGTAMYAPQFGFGHQTVTDDLTFSEMMRAEADNLGIVVTDKMVSDWINKQTQEKLSRADFAAIRQNLNFGKGVVSESELFDAFREEIKALMAYQILRPQPSSLPQGPDVYYATFKRTKVRQRLNTVRLDVDSFVGKIADPTDAEVAAFFQENRLRFPNELEPGAPGFRQFSKAKLAYLELGYKKAEATVAPPTDGEVEAFYNENKDRFYRKPAEPEASTPAKDSTPGIEPKADEPKADEPKADEPKADEPKADEPKADTDGCFPAADEQVPPVAADTPSETSAAAVPADEATSPAPQADTPAAGQDAADGPEFVIPKIEYKPLDDELKAEIREQLMDGKVRKALDERQDLMIRRMKELEEERAKYRRTLFSENAGVTPQQLNEKTRAKAPEMLAKLKAIAAEIQCEFVETPLLNFSELMEGESYPIGAASVPEGQTVAQFVFGAFPEDVTNETTTFVAHRATSNSGDPDGGEKRFGWVVTEYAPTHVPSLDDPEIREQVVLSWKRIKARDLAKARAEQLAQEIKASLAKPDGEKKTMSEIVDGQTVLGTEDSTGLSMRQTLPFSWMEQVNAPPMTFQPPSARLSSIQFADEIAGTIRFAGPKFMEGVFEDLGNNEVGVVPNEDFSSYYVVQVLDRTPDAQSGEDVLRQQFLTEGKQFGFSRGAISTVIQNDFAGPTALEWEKTTWRKYGIDPDARQDD